jgi:phage-related protein
MGETAVVFFREDDGSVPSLDWLDDLHEKVQNKFIVRINRLVECGHELRRPEADYLRDGIYELRVRHMHINYRLLYFFSGQRAILSHGITKDDKVPDQQINLAINRLSKFEHNPQKYTYVEYEG